MYNQLKKGRRMQDEFHVTLIHRANSSTNGELWQRYTDAYLEAGPSADNNKRLTPSLGAARVRLERVVWNDRIMAFVVRLLPVESGQEWQSSNTIPHITVGTASKDIKPKESNDLLARWMEGGEGAKDIKEKEVSGMKVLEGTVKPVMQRGR